ncbi:MAG: peptidyl-prolyl cis-trans isomerase [Candidatus Sulfotelmatobacter sp.]
MRKSWVLCVLMGALAWGQAAPGGPPTQSSPAAGAGAMNGQAEETEKDASASVPPSAPVITIDGVCDTPAKTTTGAAAKPATATKTAAAGCKTVITKAQFDAMASNLAPNITPQLKKQLASVLPRLMAMSNEAKKQGLENTPQYKERVKFYRMQFLAQELQQKMQEQAAKVPEADIDKYYKDHPEMFEQASVERVFVPRMKQIEPEKLQDEKETKAGDQQQKEAAEKAKQDEGEKVMTKLADDLRARAAAGEDFLKLQKEAFDAAGMKIESPTVTLPNIRRSGLPPAHAAVFDLKPGEVSQVISDSGGHYIYKVVSKNPMTLDQAKTEIQGKLQSERMKDEMDKLNNSFKVETNEAYFGPGGANPSAPRPMRPRPGMPPAPGASAPQAQPPAAKPQ